MSDAARKTIEMKKRTKQFALRVIRLVRELPKGDEARIIGQQLLRSGTSVGANYRALCRARSDREFVSKAGVVVEEADESAFWMELIVEAELMSSKRVSLLLQECNEILAIIAAAYNTARRPLK
jgi:four helix bundle protein